MFLFAAATLTPFLLILAAAFAGGPWGWLALGYITVLVFVLDRVMAPQWHNRDPEAEFPAADGLLLVLAALHLVVLGVAIRAVAGASGLDPVERGLVALTSALAFGQISHPVAHDLLHRPARHLHMLGRLVYASILFGHHASAHLRVHHVHVGTKQDPNSARWGEGFWRFAWRAWPGSFLAGLHAENRLRQGVRGQRHLHPYMLYLALSLLVAALAVGIAGPVGLLALLFISLYSQIQILLSDYVQHYGLRRGTQANGRLEPVGPQHSWNAPCFFSSAMTLNAPRHSDHHMTPARPYPALQMRREDMPVLPYPLPVMAVLALIPALWRRIMDARCAPWQTATARNLPPTAAAGPESGGRPGADL